MRPTDKELHLKRHKKMLAFQKKIFPFTPTIRELKKVWRVVSENTVFHTLHYLAKMKLCIVRKHGAKKSYYAIEAE